MSTPTLNDLLSGIAFKKLSAAEIPSNKNRQHEFNGADSLIGLLGKSDFKMEATIFFLPDNEEKLIEEKLWLTWYDCRKKQPERKPEYRFYYTENSIMRCANEGDSLFIIRKKSEEYVLVVTPDGSEIENQLRWLFDISKIENGFYFKELSGKGIELNYTVKIILGIIGIDIIQDADEYLDEMLRKFGKTFPNTKVFSEYARTTLTNTDPEKHPDESLIKYLDREESLFKILERFLVIGLIEKELAKGLKDVDAFIKFTLSINNRRKSRAGHAFENHLSFIFDESNLRYSWGKRTERNKRPDFLFPGIDYYHKADFPDGLLTMLGAKTTAKDRWPQVLSEAERINTKHLITLQPSISLNQTEEMKANNLVLVVPGEIQNSYTDNQRKDILLLEDFIKVVKTNQLKMDRR